ncbi:MAG: hypothetical protein GX807_00500 [Erysipelotrichia bacterium]|nr:hypothetical protein [Erysipelotrichia bacterium]
MYYCHMNQEQLVFLFIALGTFAFGLIIFIFSCIYYVKKDHVMIIEKMQQYHGTYTRGIYWFWPFAYRRVGYYALVPLKRKIHLYNGRKVLVEYQIDDPLKYHYFKTNVESFINKIAKENEELNLEVIKKNFATIGITFIGIKPLD